MLKEDAILQLGETGNRPPVLKKLRYFFFAVGCAVCQTQILKLDWKETTMSEIQRTKCFMSIQSYNWFKTLLLKS